jgi:outer membrane biosynthesis protein TonB
MKALLIYYYLLTPLLVVLAITAQAQGLPSATPADEQVYSYATQMPELLTGGGRSALEAFVRQQVVMPAEVKAGKTDGRLEARFVVGDNGQVRDAVVIRHLSPAADAAALAALRKLPTLRPGQHNGQPVAVSFDISLEFFGPHHVFNYAVQMPVARTGDISSYLRKNLRVPAIVAAEKLSGEVGVRFVVLPSGRVDSVKVGPLRLCPSCDAEVERVVRSLPSYYPARNEAGQPVAVWQSLTVALPLPPEPAQPDSLARYYTYVSQMPSLPTGGGVVAIDAAAQKNFIAPTNLSSAETGRVFVQCRIGPHGSVYALEVKRGLSPRVNEAAMAAVRKLGHLVPGQQNGFPVAVQVVMQIIVVGTP